MTLPASLLTAAALLAGQVPSDPPPLVAPAAYIDPAAIGAAPAPFPPAAYGPAPVAPFAGPPVAPVPVPFVPPPAPFPLSPEPAAATPPPAVPYGRPYRQPSPSLPPAAANAKPRFAPPGGVRAPRSTSALSFIHVPVPEPRVLKVHDIITVLVDEKSEVTVQSRFDRRRNATLAATLNEFVRLDDFGRLRGSALGAPGVDADSGVRMQATGNQINAEGIRYRIAAEVVDVLPNGNVVLEARKTIRSGRDLWEYTLTGTISSQKVRRDLTAISEDVAALRIEKRQSGNVHSSASPGWGVRVLDLIWPF